MDVTEHLDESNGLQTWTETLYESHSAGLTFQFDDDNDEYDAQDHGHYSDNDGENWQRKRCKHPQLVLSLSCPDKKTSIKSNTYSQFMCK